VPKKNELYKDGLCVVNGELVTDKTDTRLLFSCHLKTFDGINDRIGLLLQGTLQQ
jgi:hypothetical protein